MTASFVIPNECEKSRFMLRISLYSFFLSRYDYHVNEKKFGMGLSTEILMPMI